MEIVVLSCRTLLVVVLAVAAMSKIRDAESYAAFTGSVRELTELPARPARTVAAIVVAAEAGAVVLLLAPSPSHRAGFALAGGLFGAFTVAIAASLRRGVRGRCRCFGASESRLGPVHLVRNALLITVAGTGALGASDSLPGAPGGLALAVGTGLVLGVVVTVLDDIGAGLRDAVRIGTEK
ncbi:MauE/DoxX family redox-associated membrane protein [Streptomyces clavuligerus]|nr:MauE/DoxX family redox-associated membrane protein [Streptomyces clavuligerus]WDN56857.1 methylamine utilization protein MauE [Streptomyces clavuligerus]